MRINTMAIGIITALLVIVNWLTFHDVFETHTMRDWLTFAVSSLVLLYFVANVLRKRPHADVGP